MIRKPRVTVLRLMKWVGVAAVVLAVVRYPYEFIRQQQRFRAREQEGNALIQSYAAQRPTGVSPASWDEAIGSVRTAWSNVVFSPEHMDSADLDAILAETRALSAGATPVTAEGDLYRILDLLAHTKTNAGIQYLSSMRHYVKSAIPGHGRPSPGLVLYALSHVGPRTSKSAVATIDGGFRSSDWRVRVACCRALGQYALGLGDPDEAEAALDRLDRALDDGDPLVREIAVECLYETGPKAARLTDRLVALRAHDPSSRVRWQAVRALPAIQKDPAALIPALIAAIVDHSPSIGRAALESLEEMGTGASESLPAVRSALGDRDEDIRAAAAKAIAKISPPSVAVPVLIDVLKSDRNWQVRWSVAHALAGIGPPASAALPALIDRLETDDAPATRMAAAEALAKVAPDDLRTVGSLARALKRETAENVRARIADALGQIGPPAAPAVPSLTDSLNDPDSYVRGQAETALQKIRARP
jgi:HEAT repeat protein